MVENSIEIKNLTTKYGDKIIHDNISFTVEKNSLCSLIGGSGSGKTTLFKVLLGLLKPASGYAKVLSQDLNKISPQLEKQLRKNTAVLFQDGALFSGLTIEDNVFFPVNEILEIGKKAKSKIVEYWLKQVDLEADVAKKMPSELSGGMRKRVGLARALILEPDLLFLDEPTSGLDPITARNFDKLIKDLQKQLKMTVLMISHDIDSITALSDKVVALGNQKLIAEGTLSEVLKSPDPWIQNYFQRSHTC